MSAPLRVVLVGLVALTSAGCRGLEPPEELEWQQDEDISGFEEDLDEEGIESGKEMLGS